jgi:hypothetical protein
MPSVLLFKGVKKTKWSDRGLRATMLAQMNHYVSVLKKDYALTTATWSDKPKFEAIEAFSPDGPTVLVGTDSKIYGYADEGTGLYGKKHAKYRIPKLGNTKAKRLVFYTPSTAKTRPNWIGSGPGSKGTVKNVRRSVMHPGIKPRNFTAILQKKHQPAFKKAMQDVLTKWAKEDSESK